MKNALVIGVTGQDGSYIADFLLKKGYNVFGTFRRTSHRCFERLEELKIFNDITRIKGDVLDQYSLRAVFKKSQPDEVYNLAAQSFVGASFEQPIITADITGLGTLRVLEALKEITPDAKFYQASSSEMFGNYPGAKNENSMFKPRSPYGVAKVFAHHMTNHYREAYNIFACCGILFNHESPLRGMEFVTRRISYHIALVKYKKISKFTLGNIHVKRDWGFAGDYVKAMWSMLQQQKPDDYVIATGETHSIEEFLELATEYAGLKDWQKFVEIDKSIFRPTEIDVLLGDPTKAKKQLGWKNETLFKDLVKTMVEHDLELVKMGIDPLTMDEN